MQRYRHSQFGTVVVAALLAGLVVEVWTACLLVRSGEAYDFPIGILAAVGVLLAVALVLFYRMTVEVGEDRVGFRMGVGISGRKISVEQISSCEAVKNRMWHGWGIHYYGAGWLYSVSGFGAVQIVLKSGRQLRIGTDEPESLCAAIEEAMGKRR